MAKAAAAQEEIKNCPTCKKHLKKAKRYYRNNQYYCNKNCWISGRKKAEAAKAQADS